MQHQQLEINRSESPFRSFRPRWTNLAGVLVAVALLLVASFWTVNRSRTLLTRNIASKLETVLSIETEAVRQWAESEKHFAGLVASDPQLATLMVSDAESSDTARQIKTKLDEISTHLRNKTCLLMTIDGRVIASSGEKWLPEKVRTLDAHFCETLVSGKTTLSPVLLPSEEHPNQSQYSIVVSAPIKDSDQQTVGFLGIGHNLSRELTDVLASSRSGLSGETIAVTEQGQLISQSRFEDTSTADPSWLARLEGNLPAATTINLQGQPDQRGVKSVMAYHRIPRLGIGLVTKMDHAEANGPVNQILRFVWTLFGMIVLTTFSTLFYRAYLYRIRSMSQAAELARKRLGAYELEERIGEGGMGVVYQAKHALMRRPTAVKILPPEKSSPEAISRFEREVQLTSQLKHPNTISIYDYGRTENGLFYYAMELLDGVSLEQLVLHNNEIPDGRILSILRQVGLSLREAHHLGLIHRDIKPANIMVCDRGGAYDTVKVLDFGIIHEFEQAGEPASGELSGTPNYMAPECFVAPQDIDTRVDIFAVGAVGYFLLTGKPLLDAASFPALLKMHQSDLPSLAKAQILEACQRRENQVAGSLIELIVHCVAPQPDDRPISIDGFLESLDQCTAAQPWSNDAAERWWSAARFLSCERLPESSIESVKKQQFSLDTTLTFEIPREKPVASSSHR